MQINDIILKFHINGNERIRVIRPLFSTFMAFLMEDEESMDYRREVILNNVHQVLSNAYENYWKKIITEKIDKSAGKGSVPAVEIDLAITSDASSCSIWCNNSHYYDYIPYDIIEILKTFNAVKFMEFVICNWSKELARATSMNEEQFFRMLNSKKG
jgi:hypothetical protein